MDGSGMVVDWDSDSSGLELDRRELVLGWRGWRLALSTKAARVSAPVVPHCLLSALLLPAPRVIRNCPAGPGAGRARVLVAAGPVCRRAIRTPRWWLIRWAPGQARRICASAGCCGGGRRVGTGVGCGESAAAGRRGHGCGGSGGVWAWGAERRLALGVGSVAAVWARRTWASVCGLRRRASAASLAPGR